MGEFDAARRAAVMGDLLRHLRGRPADLLSFDEVREGLELRHLRERYPERTVPEAAAVRHFRWLRRREAGPLRRWWRGLTDRLRGR